MTLQLITGGHSRPAVPPLFDAILDHDGRRQLEARITLVEIGEGQTLAREGDVGHDYLMVAEGLLLLSKTLANDRRQVLAFRGPGDLVTLHRHNTPWPMNAQAITGGKLYKIKWEELWSLSRRYPAIERALFDLACDEVTNLQNRTLLLGRMTTDEKTASFILEFCRPFSSQSSLSRNVRLPMRRRDIADYLGLTMESVSRALSRFKRKRIIAMPRSTHIVVLNRDALEAIAMGSQSRGEGDYLSSLNPAM
jgi:CRP/FNR family transcriptional regulator